MDFTPQVETREIADADLDNVSGGLVGGVVGTAVGTVDGAVGQVTGTASQVTGLDVSGVTGVAGL
jgi:hypothetical protein